MKKNKYYLYAFTILLCCSNPFRLQAQTFPINGIVLDSLDGKPLQGVTILRGRPAVRTTSQADGQFTIRAAAGDSITFSMMGYQPHSRLVTTDGQTLTIKLTPNASQLEEVIINTGYQQLAREQLTGSVDVVGQELLNRSVSTDLLSRLENLTPGLLFNRGDAAATDPFLIRGRSSITADAQPLIVLDDFPYEGDLSNINPNDVASVSILKDAAAASIWGARAANGVIVITSKKGSTAKPKVEIGSNLTIQAKPDLYNVSSISAADRIAWERLMFQQGKYDPWKDPAHPIYESISIPLAAELFIANPPDLEDQLDALKQNDIRDDLSRYFYQTSVRQQYSINLSGMQQKWSYLFSGGYDHNRANLVGESDQRFTLRSMNTYTVSPSLTLSGTISYTQNNSSQGHNNGLNSGYERYGLSPYARFADETEAALPHYSLFRPGFLDTAGNGQLLDWNLRPLEEIGLRKNDTRTGNYLINLGGQYTLFTGLQLSLTYQYQQQLGKGRDLYQESSFYARNEINRFTQLNPVTGAKTYPVPIGGIMLASDEELLAHQARAQLIYQKTFHEEHGINMLAGYELRSRVTEGLQYQFYGYKDSYRSVISNLDFFNPYPVNTGEGVGYINNLQVSSKLTDQFLSYFANGSYSFANRYIISGSFRKDEANLFGTLANQKGTPLWSGGVAWHLHREQFYRVTLLPTLTIRASYGVNGNISRAASAYTVAVMTSGGHSHQFPTASIQTPPNANLRWERVYLLNLSADFSLKNEVLSGSVEYYKKRSADLLAQAPLDPTLGFISAYSNTAAMRNQGLDVQLNSQNLRGTFGWQSHLIYSYSRNEVSEYLMPVSARGGAYATNLSSIAPVVGRPLYSAYSYSWAGLDPVNGDPMIYLNNAVSKDYSAIYNAPLDQMVYHGPVQPVHFGALRNTFTYHQLSLSFNISYKLGHYFRTPTVFNTALSDYWNGHGDYALRWTKPGDEQITHVPAMVYPASSQRDEAYAYSSVHIHRADVVRLEDIQVSYVFQRKNAAFPFQQLKLFIYASNLGLLWKSVDSQVDPYYNNVPRIAHSFSFGTQFTF